MKTIKEWLKTLPETYRWLALSNLETCPIDVGAADKQVANLAQALFAAFWWDENPEGDDFWSEVHRRALAGEFDTRDIDCTIPEETA